MNRFDDLLPEERVPEHDELITLLKHAYRAPISLSSTKEKQIIERVRERLLQRGLEVSPQEEDVRESQIGVLDSNPHITVFPSRIPLRNRQRFRLIALLAAAFVLAVLLISPLLIFRHSSTGGPGFPTLTLSANPAKVGQKVVFTLRHVTPSTRVVLTQDIQPIQINGRAFIIADSKGNASFSLSIDKNWGSGSHFIVAEDVATRNTASAYLQIIGQGSSPLPPSLLISSSSIHMGADVVGANTIRTVNLVNSGDGSITWSASSNQSWLLVSPSQGIFSKHETISLVVLRAGLKPGNYNGNIVISTNVSPPQDVEVDMTVRPLPSNSAPVLALPSALLSFTATDGQSNPISQTLTLSNPGSIPLYWSLSINASALPITQLSLIQAQAFTCNWLSATPNAGIISPGATKLLKVHVNSRCLLPGSYAGTLKFSANGAIDSSQEVNVSLTVQPNCGLITSTGYLAFTVVKGQNNIPDQTVSLNTTPGCVGKPISWNSFSTASWLMSSPENGVLKGPVHISVNAKKLPPGIYTGNIFFVTGHSSLTVTVALTVQAAPPLASPIMSASPLSLNFSNIQGQPNPTNQVITISNNGPKTPLNWHINLQALVPSWLTTSLSGGTIDPGQSEQVNVQVNDAQLVPGNYVGQIAFNGMDASGKSAPGTPQIITVNLVVQPPCTISPPSSSVLSFSAVQGASVTPVAQTVMFTAWGGCEWPLTWKTSVTSKASWLNLTQTSSSGSIGGNGQSSSIKVTPNITGLVASTYSTTLTIAASNANGVVVQGSAQTFTVILTVLPPCLLSTPTPATLTFSLAQGQTSLSALTVGLSESGTCARPVTWQASTSSSWLTLTRTSGTDSGTGSSFGVNASAVNESPGTSAGTITITATDSSGATVGSAQSVAVTLTVTGFTISGNVQACLVPNCASSQALPGATVTIVSGNTTIATTTTDASGNYSFSNIPLGSYSINVTGYDASHTPYSGSLSLTLTGNTTNTTLQALPT
jgi:carboxypeptidase family protein/BACON domain-containing protein